MLRALPLLIATLLSVPLLAVPADAGLVIPVNCSTDKVVLDMDGASYDLDGTCGVVVVTADDAKVSMPAAQKLVVRGHGNTVHAKPIVTLVVRGRDQWLAVTSVRAMRAASPGSTVRVEGLLEEARVAKRGLELTARQISALVVSGRGHDVAARRGYDARLAGDHSHATFRRLDKVVLTGDDNAVRVGRGTTVVRDSGSGNRVRVIRRG